MPDGSQLASARTEYGGLSRESGGLYHGKSAAPCDVRPLFQDELVLGESYYFALDGLGRPVWPFRWRLLSKDRVLGQKWRLGAWSYSRELDALWSGLDDRWISAKREQVEHWIRRQGYA